MISESTSIGEIDHVDGLDFAEFGLGDLKVEEGRELGGRRGVKGLVVWGLVLRVRVEG